MLIYSLMPDHPQHGYKYTHSDFHRIKKDILSRAKSLLEEGLELAEQARKTLTSAKLYFGSPFLLQEIKFTLKEYDNFNHKRFGAHANHIYSGSLEMWSRPSSRNKHLLELSIDIPGIGKFKFVIPLNTTINPDILHNTALLNYLKNPSEQTLNTFLKDQIDRQLPRIEAWIKEFQKYKAEFDELKKQI